MLYRVAADTVLIVHLAFILYVVLGGFIALRWPWTALLHLPAAAWGGFIELFGGICPLTTWENVLLRRAGESGYAGGFIEHYLVPLVYPAGLTRAHQLGLAGFVFAINVVIYACLWKRRRGARK